MPPVLYIKESVQISFEHFSYIKKRKESITERYFSNIANDLLWLNAEAPSIVGLYLKIAVMQIILPDIECLKVDELETWIGKTIKYYHMQLSNCDCKQYYDIDISNRIPLNVCGKLYFEQYIRNLLSKDSSLNPYSCYFLTKKETYDCNTDMKEQLPRILSKNIVQPLIQNKDSDIIKALKLVDVNYTPESITSVVVFLEGYEKFLERSQSNVRS